MGDLWQEVPKDEYWDTFCGIVDLKGKDSGDIFLLTVDYLIKHESIYFYTLGGKVYIQSPETELSESKRLFHSWVVWLFLSDLLYVMHVHNQTWQRT